MGLLDFAQAASNAAASNVSGPVDLLAWLLSKAGVNVGEPVGGSEWMKRKGLTKDVKPGAAQVAGETVGLLSPVAAAAKAPQIASGLLKMGENAAARSTLNPQTGAIVWHGSPHKFDRFDSSKIGTGEGAQAYGHGLYLAEAPDVAMSYQPRDPRLEQKIMQRYSAAERSQQYPAMQVFEDFLLHKTPQEVADNIAQAGYSAADKRLAESALKLATKEYHSQRAGALYKVDLPDSAIAKMLDWDKPLSQQAPGVREAFGGFPLQMSAGDAYRAKSYGVDPVGFNDAGQALFDGMAALRGRNPAAAAEALRRAGVPGVRYLDGGSRGAGTGTSNFVVFPGEEGLLTILERNGAPLR